MHLGGVLRPTGFFILLTPANQIPFRLGRTITRPVSGSTSPRGAEDAQIKTKELSVGGFGHRLQIDEMCADDEFG